MKGAAFDRGLLKGAASNRGLSEAYQRAQREPVLGARASSRTIGMV